MVAITLNKTLNFDQQRAGRPTPKMDVRSYQRVDSEAYLKEVKEIKRRMGLLPLYQP